MPALALADADRSARTALHRLDSGAHDLEFVRVVALREALAALREGLRGYPGRFGIVGWRIATPIVLAAVVYGLGAGSGTFVSGPLSGRAIVAAACWGALLYGGRAVIRWMERHTPDEPVPESPMSLAELADEILDAVRAGTESARWSRRTLAAHLEVRAVAVWSLVNGGPAVDVVPCRVPRAGWPVVGRMHRLLHLVRDGLGTVDDEAARFRVARYDIAYRLVKPVVPRGSGPLAILAFFTLVMTVLTVIVSRDPYGIGLGYAIVIASAGLFGPFGEALGRRAAGVSGCAENGRSQPEEFAAARAGVRHELEELAERMDAPLRANMLRAREMLTEE